MADYPDETRRPSRWWLAVSSILAAMALTTAVAAIMVQRGASIPIGEWEVFVGDATSAGQIIDAQEDPATAVRSARNELGIEAVSLAGADGTIVASTSPPMDGAAITSPLLSFGVNERRFAAVAGPVEHDVVIDGVTEWVAGSILYQVVSPRDDGTSLLLHYDISEMLGRRARPAGIQSETVQLLGATAILAILAAMVFVGHTRASRNYRQVVAESEALAAANIELAEARNRAERALALAEEKIRIRSEFVLMINHELRTPLTSVVTGSRLVRDGDISEEERRRLLDAVVADGTRLQEMIDQILAVARVENQGLAYPMRRVSASELIQILSGLGLECAEDFRYRSRAEAVLLTDPRSLALLVASLADNARTHGARAVTVTLSHDSDLEPMIEVGERPEQAVYITVSDDGPGIAPDFLPRMFEKFEKSSFSSGTGLGLYLARLMIEALQGSIAVATSPAGSSFQVAVPMIATVARVDAA